MINPEAMAKVLDGLADNFDRAALEQWKGLLNPGADQSAALRELAGRLRSSRESAALLHRTDITFLLTQARALRRVNEPRAANEHLSTDSRANATAGLEVADQLERLAEWIHEGFGESAV